MSSKMSRNLKKAISMSTYIEKNEQQMSLFLYCRTPLDTKNWAIDTKFTPKFVGTNGRTVYGEYEHCFENSDGNEACNVLGRAKFISLEELEKDYLVDDKLAVEIHVKVNKMTGIYKENLECFDETKKNYSDVMLIVKDQKFYVAKLFLAFHSSYFDSLFLGAYLESNKSKIELTGIEPEDFQNFLEVLYGKSSIDEVTVEGILLVADMYDTPIVIEKCVNFLIAKSEKSNKKKLQMAIRYNLDELKTKCMSDIETVEDIESVIPGNVEDLDHSILAKLLKKSISLH